MTRRRDQMTSEWDHLAHDDPTVIPARDGQTRMTFRDLEDAENDLRLVLEAGGKLGVYKDPDGANERVGELPGGGGEGTIGVTFDGGGAEVEVGKKAFLPVPYGHTIESYDLVADGVGSIEIDIQVDTFGNFPPTSADSITGSDPPKLVAADKASDSSLPGWTKTFPAGSVYLFEVISCDAITYVTLVLKVAK